MTLGQLIDFLEKQDPALVVPYGFHQPHSYRGYYYDLAFQPTEQISFADMLAAAKSALGQTFVGWKGGEYPMKEYTTVWIARYGEGDGEGIGLMLLQYMVEAAGKPA